MKLISIIILFLSFSTSFSQEICDNGIDDDGNGLIDLQDSACYCLGTVPDDSIASLIPNHSFEDTNCCPTTQAQMYCATSWQQASWGTSDYFNTCGFGSFIAYCSPPNNIPHGNGYIGFLDALATKEYIGTCLSDTLFAGVNHKITFEMGYCHGPNFNTMAIFGTGNCAALPFTSSLSGGPPLTNWKVLDSINVILDISKWNKFELNFIPSINITTLVIGPGFKQQKNAPYQWRYYFLDNLILNETYKFGPNVKIISKGKFCMDNLLLLTEFDSIPNSIQWYKDNIAIKGETNSKISVSSDSPGTYKVRFIYNNGCIIKSYKTISNEDYLVKMPNVFSPNNDGINDLFKPIEFNNLSNAKLKIYNRWGQIVYETSGLPFSWNGRTNEKDCSAGVYFWTVQNEECINESGNVSLFR